MDTLLAAVATDTWGETTISRNNRPSKGEALASATVSSTGCVDFDVTGHVSSRSDNLLSFALF